MFWKELTTGIYPWDMHDEGIEAILDNLQHKAGNNAAYLVSQVHYEKRPPHDIQYPHNPVRKYYIPEDSRVYFAPREEMYRNSRIKPLRTERDFLKDVDWLDRFTEALRRRGMKTGAELSHTPLDAARAMSEFSDCLQRDVHGRFPLAPVFGMITQQQLCWNNPVARDYVYALAADLVRNHDIDVFQNCIAPFNPGRYDRHPLLGVLLGGCFCEHCEREARAAGLDFDRIKETALYFSNILNQRDHEAREKWLLIERGNSSQSMLLLEYPEIFEWMQFRCRSYTRFVKELSQVVHGERSNIDMRFNVCWKNTELFGVDLAAIAPYIDSVRIQDYAEQYGDEQAVKAKGKWIANVRRQIGEEKTIIGGIAVRGKITQDLLRQGIRENAMAGVDGLSYGFYDGATMQRLNTIRETMEALEVQLR